MSIIKVGCLISYDYEFLKISLPRIYDHVAEIFFAVDKDGLTWDGHPFEIDDEFWIWLKEFDTENKIIIYEDHFYIRELTPMECDTRERNLLCKKMGKADWYIQIDADEYFVDFGSFINKLNEYNTDVSTSIYCSVATLFKHAESGYFLIGDSSETLSIATNNPVYDLARNNESGNEHIHWKDLILHQSWARTSDEIQLKLNNWSHKNDFNTTSFYKLWDAIDEYNYHCLSNFHPLQPSAWPGLVFIQGTIPEILDSEELIKLKNPVEATVRKKTLLSRLWKEIKA